MTSRTDSLLFDGADWDYDKIKRAYDAIEEIAFKELGLDIYPNQIEVISAEQMLDAYSSIGLPLMYKHWSFGKHFARDEVLYRKGLRGLAYEIVINSSPCISYIMEENTMSQYVSPQKQTKVMNEGCATTTHYHIMNRLYEKDMLSDGAMLEFLHSHTSVVFQPGFDDPRYAGLNPYTLGFEMMQDIRRVCTEPTAEDRDWFPLFAGCGDPWGVLREAWANYRDESFILQYLSPTLIRRMRLFHIHDDPEQPHLEVSAIHNEQGYQTVRKSLARQHDLAHHEPDIQIVDVDLFGDRKLILHHRVHNGILLEEKETRSVLRHLANLWGYDVKLYEVDATSDKVLKEFGDVSPTVHLG